MLLKIVLTIKILCTLFQFEAYVTFAADSMSETKMLLSGCWFLVVDFLLDEVCFTRLNEKPSQ